MNEENKNVHTPDFEGEKMKMPENSDTRPAPEEEESTGVINGPLLFGLAVLLIAILGGMYYWFASLTVSNEEEMPVIDRPTAEENNEPESTTAEAQVETLQAVSTSDEIEAIEADLEATNLDSLDAELNAIDAEIEAALSTEL
ncbi:hypothetical protein KC865_03300 [Candidatus Kaiserbacteria bacterium]|nr:hypothetical protein [Candidatus Kaiserbacteria bacterium]USN92491.1 MAG: hypothetical protein H6782_01595 [Candidatus Nomurabacteria bacterium]